MIWLFRVIGRLPLWLNHTVGSALGWLVWYGSRRHRNLTREHIAQYARHMKLDDTRPLLRAAIAEQGKGLSELALAWTAPLSRLQQLIAGCSGWEYVDAARVAQRPIIFVTPHLGCYDIAGRYLASRLPITAMFRPPKLASLEPLMREGRERGGATTVPADGGGVRGLLKELKRGGSIMILPDQVPAPEQGGDGEWVPFFGRPAYTMTLLPRLARSANAVVLFFFAERLAGGQGYRIHIEPMPEAFSTDRKTAADQTNRMVEKLVAMAPAQYLWGYNRYKRPAGAPLPAAS